MTMPFIIDAVVQPVKGSQWLKVSYISRNNDVAWHMDTILRREYYSVASVKSRPADEVELNELRCDAQGNTMVIDNRPLVLEEANEYVVPNDDPSPNN